MKKLIIIICGLAIAAPVEGQIIHVPSDYPTIQAGIDVATTGDTVLVDEGTYFENINFFGKAITVASNFIMDSDTNHINNTIIDGSQPENPEFGSVVTFITGEDTTSVICGFTITGGSGMAEPIYDARIGGGIVCYYASAKIIHNKIMENEINSDIYAWGAGIASIKETGLSWTIVENNTIRDNQSICLNGTSTSDAATGGGMEIWGNARVCNNIIESNECYCETGMSGGGGIVMQSINTPSDTLKLFNNIIRNNLTHSENWYAPGGGVFSIYSICLISNNLIENNQCDGFTGTYGGGIGVQYVDATLYSNTIRFNSIAANDGAYGGGVSSWYSTTYIYENEISRNSVSAYEGVGGGIHFYYSEEVEVENNNINYNICVPNNTSAGGGVACFYPTTLTKFRNNEFAGNLVPIYLENPQLMPYSAGGGLYIYGGDSTEVLADGNIFTADTAKDGGGFFSRNSYNVKLANNIFHENVAYRGGAIGINHTQTSGPDKHPLFANNTLVENYAISIGGAFWFTGSINIPYIFNSLFYENTAPSGPEIRNLSTLPIVVSYSLIDTNSITGNWTGEENIIEDPGFIHEDSLYHLSDTSACINAGIDSLEINGSVYHCPSVDYDGEPRPDTEFLLVDIGADEFDFGTGTNEPLAQKITDWHSVYPNPFTDQAILSYEFDRKTMVEINLYNSSGELIQTLLSAQQEAGKHELQFSPGNLPAGIYLYRITTDSKQATGRMILTK